MDALWRESRSRMRWQNVPVPEQHVTALVLSAILAVYRPFRLVRRPHRVRRLGWVLLGLSGLTIATAVRAVGTADIEEAQSLVTAFPYSYSRNPMYVAWTGLYVGIGLFCNTVWPFVCLPAVVGWTQLVIRREEKALARTFGAEYQAYCDTVPRYL
jgi:protein-S-isoprenylcysteine O-methyltransferase Ste14